jgi:hypothetical protein
MSDDINLDALYMALTRDGAFSSLSQIDRAALQLMPEKGLAHDHVRIVGTGLLLRVPRQSQFAFAAADNLTYQSACFERASQGAHAPRLHGVLPPSQDVPMGALVVDEIEGRSVELPADLAALADCLASIHSLDIPPPEDRPPLAYHHDPIAGTLAFINEQAHFLDDATDDKGAISLIKEELRWARAFADENMNKLQPTTLVASDTHPGNYVVDQTGRAYIVDLEKALYGSPAIDLAHCSLYTSTTWDIAASYIVDPADVIAFYRSYFDSIEPALVLALKPWLLPLRRLTWLRSTTWSAKWRVESHKLSVSGKEIAENTEDWSAENRDTQLMAHVEERTRDFLSVATVEHICAEWRTGSELAAAL